MSKKYIASTEIKLKDTRYCLVAIKAINYNGYNFEVMVKEGTSNNGWYFYDASQAMEFYQSKITEIKKEQEV
jgi:hypothetical protein